MPTRTVPSSTIALFRRWSTSYDRPWLQRSNYRPLHDALLSLLADLDTTTAPGDRRPRVLDVGCGTGRFLERLTSERPSIDGIGLDPSLDMLAGRGPDQPVTSGAAAALPIASGSIDAVVCCESFHWYPDQAAALDEMARVTRPGGRIAIVSIAPLTAGGTAVIERATRATGAPIRAVTAGELRRLARSAGLEVVEQRRVPRPPPLPWPLLHVLAVSGRSPTGPVDA